MSKDKSQFIFPFTTLNWEEVESLYWAKRNGFGGLPVAFIPVYDSIQSYREAGYEVVPCGTFAEGMDAENRKLIKLTNEVEPCQE